MAEFTPITFNSQEEYDNAFKERIAREQKKYESYTSPDALKEIESKYQKQIEELAASAKSQEDKYKNFDEQLAEANKKIAQYESDSAKTRIAIKHGIPIELAGKISGSTEKEMEEDAKKIASFVSSSPKKAPGYTPSTSDADGVTKRFLELNPSLKI